MRINPFRTLHKQHACVIKHFTTYEQNECACSSQFLSANQPVVKKQAWEIILITLFKHLYLPFSDVWIRTFWISPMCSFNRKPPGCCCHLTWERKGRCLSSIMNLLYVSISPCPSLQHIRPQSLPYCHRTLFCILTCNSPNWDTQLLKCNCS